MVLADSILRSKYVCISYTRTAEAFLDRNDFVSTARSEETTHAR